MHCPSENPSWFNRACRNTVADVVKQGGILGSALCSASTGEYCTVNKGVTVGDLQIATLAYVDDIFDLNEIDEDVSSSEC